MMTANRYFSIELSGQPVNFHQDAYKTVSKLSAIGIKTSQASLYRMKRGESKTVQLPNSKIPKQVKITCER
jgi:hypothetical protein